VDSSYKQDLSSNFRGTVLSTEAVVFIAVNDYNVRCTAANPFFAGIPGGHHPDKSSLLSLLGVYFPEKHPG
jgi:hypothetical protein